MFLIVFNDALFIFHKTPQFFHDYFLFNKDKTSRITRQSNLLHLPKVHAYSGMTNLFTLQGVPKQPENY